MRPPVRRLCAPFGALYIPFPKCHTPPPTAPIPKAPPRSSRMRCGQGSRPCSTLPMGFLNQHGAGARGQAQAAASAWGERWVGWAKDFFVPKFPKTPKAPQNCKSQIQIPFFSPVMPYDARSFVHRKGKMHEEPITQPQPAYREKCCTELQTTHRSGNSDKASARSAHEQHAQAPLSPRIILLKSAVRGKS